MKIFIPVFDDNTVPEYNSVQFRLLLSEDIFLNRQHYTSET